MTDSGMPIIGCSEFGRQLVEILGLKGKRVHTITLDVRVDEPVSVSIGMHVIDREAGEIADLLKKYQLIAKPE